MPELLKQITLTDHTQDFRFQLVGKIYEAGMDRTVWPDVLAGLSEIMGAERAMILSHDMSSGTGRVHYGFNMGSDWRMAYAQMLYQFNSWFARLACWKQGSVLRDEEIVAREEFREGAFYRRFLRPQGIEHSVFAVVAATGSRRVLVVLGRGAAAGAFSDSELALLRCFGDHLHRAWETQHAHARRDLVEQGTIGALNLLSVGVVMIDSHGEVLSLNDAARAVIDRDDGLRLCGGVLKIMGSGELVRYTPARLAPGMGTEFPVGILSAPRKFENRPYTILVYPMENTELQEEAGTAALAFIADPDRMPRDSGALLRQIYGFTPAEARVAVLVAQGQRIQDIASGLEISVHTARTHLKRIFEKAGVVRQAELVHVIYGCLGLVRAGGKAAMPSTPKDIPARRQNLELTDA